MFLSSRGSSAKEPVETPDLRVDQWPDVEQAWPWDVLAAEVFVRADQCEVEDVEGLALVHSGVLAELDSVLADGVVAAIL